MQKTFNAKVFTLAGAYISTLSPSIIMDWFSYSEQVNGGQGELRMKLAVPFASTLVGNGNIIKLFAVTEAYPTGYQIYTGIIWSLKRVSNTTAEYIELRAIGVGSMLSWGYYTSGGAYSFSKSQDPSVTLKEIVDNFSAQYPGIITYTGTSVETVGTSANTTFAYKKRDEAILNVAGLSTYFWTIDGRGVLQFHPKTGGLGMLIHNVTVGKDIDLIEVDENTERVTNRYIVDYTSGTLTTNNVPSQTTNGIRETYASRLDLTNVWTATLASNTFISQNKDAKRKVVVTINSLYNIESIRAGDSLTIKNLDYSITTLQISRLEYNIDIVRVELEAIDSFAKEVLS